MKHQYKESLPIEESTSLSKVPAFSLLKPDNLEFAVDILDAQYDVLSQIRRSYSKPGEIEYSNSIVGFDYDVLSAFMFPFHSDEKGKYSKRKIQEKSVEYAVAKAIFTFLHGEFILPIGTILDIEKALETFRRKTDATKIVEKLISEIEDDNLESTDDILIDLISNVYSSSGILSRDLLIDDKWANAIFRLKHILFDDHTKKKRRKNKWKLLQLSKDQIKVHRSTFNLTLNYLQKARKSGDRRYANIADALSISQYVRLILNERKGKLGDPPEQPITEYLFITNTQHLWDSKFWTMLTRNLKSELGIKGKLYLDPFIVPSERFLNTSIASESPFSLAFKTEVADSQILIDNLKGKLIRASESAQWETFRTGNHECKNVADLIIYLGNMATGLPHALGKYMRFRETSLFQATIGTRMEAARLKNRYLIEGTTAPSNKTILREKRIVAIQNCINQLDSFLNEQFSKKFRNRMGLEMDHFGLEKSMPGEINEDTGMKCAYILNKSSTKKQKDTWLSITQYLENNPEISWSCETGIFEAFSIAQKLEMHTRSNHFNPGKTAKVILRSTNGEIKQRKVDTFQDYKNIYRLLLEKIKGKLEIEQIQCIFNVNGPKISISLNPSKSRRATWIACMKDIPWSKNDPQQNVEWVMKALEGTYLSTINIPGIRKWIFDTLNVMLKIK